MSDLRTDQITVLHVDDEPDLCAIVSDFLERKHDWLTVVSAADPTEGLERLQEADVDCIVSDYDMPGMDGLAFLQTVRSSHPALPFILYTGKGSEEIASEAISAGVDDYLQKGTSVEQYTVLANRIRNVVDRQRARSAATAADQRYHNLVDTAPVPIVLFCSDAEIVYVNDAATDFLEADDPEEIEDVRMPDLVIEADRGQAMERFERLFETGKAAPEMEFRIETLSNTVKRAVVATAPGTYRGERVAQAIARQVYGPE